MSSASITNIAISASRSEFVLIVDCLGDLMLSNACSFDGQTLTFRDAETLEVLRQRLRRFVENCYFDTTTEETLSSICTKVRTACEDHGGGAK